MARLALQSKRERKYVYKYPIPPLSPLKFSSLSLSLSFLSTTSLYPLSLSLPFLCTISSDKELVFARKVYRKSRRKKI